VQFAAVAGRDRGGTGSCQGTVTGDVEEVPVEPERDSAASQLSTDLEPTPAKVGDPVAIDGWNRPARYPRPVPIDHNNRY
jgi:hypothetical protein